MEATEIAKANIEVGIQASSSQGLRASPPSLSTSMPKFQGWRLALVLTSAFIGLFLSILDTSIVAVSLPTIASQFSNFDQSTWVINAYLLCYMGFAVIFARMSDFVGRKTSLVVAFVLFIAFSLGCALSQTMVQLIIFRALQGVGGSGLYSLCMVIAPSALPLNKQGMMSGAVAAVVVTSGVLGPTVGGAISSADWRWIFFLNLPVGGLALAMLLLAWPSPKTRFTFHPAIILTIDFLGALLLLAFSILLVVALQEAGTMQYAWRSVPIIACLTVSGTCLFAFLGWQQWLATHPRALTKAIFPLAAAKHRVMCSTMVVTLLSGFFYYLAVVNLPERFQIVNGDSPVIAGVRLLPLTVSSAVGSMIAGMLSSNRNNTGPTLVAASAFQVLGYGLMTTLRSGTAVQKSQYGFQVFLGLGFGMAISSSTILTITQVEPRYIAPAQGALAQLRTLGGSIGLSIATIVFNNCIHSSPALAASLSPAENIELYKSPIVIQSFTPAQKEIVAGIYASAFTQEMEIALYLSAACFVTSIFTLQRHPPPLLKGPPAPSNIAREHELAEVSSASKQSTADSQLS